MTSSVAEAEETLTCPELPTSPSTQIYRVSTVVREQVWECWLRLAWVPFIEDLSEALTSGLVAGSRDSEQHASACPYKGTVAGAQMASAWIMATAI